MIDKNIKDVTWRNPQAMDRALAAKAEGRKPDFTVTGARLDRVQQGPPLGIVIAWETQSAGFGELTIRQYEDGRVALETEGMSADFCKRVLGKLVEQASVLP